MLALLFLLAVFHTVLHGATGNQPHAIVLDGPGPWRDANWTLGVTEFTSLLTDAGYQVSAVSPANLPTTTLTPGMFLAVPNLASLPLATFNTITAFLAAQGSLMASGGQPFADPLYLVSNGQWLDQPAILQTAVPAKTVLDPAAVTLTRYFAEPQTVTQTTVTGPDGHSKALDFQLQMSAAQFFLLAAPLNQPVFNAGQTATIVWTRGTPGQSMLFEWDETDGSRWIATVPLAAQWTKQVLLPSAFPYWSGGVNRAGTAFNPSQASKFFFGVSSGQGAQPGPLEFAVSAIGVGAAPALASFTAPVLETLSPWYKQYVTQSGGQSVRIPIARGRGITATADPDGRYSVIGNLLSPVATRYVSTGGSLTIWLPWPHLQNPQRAQLVALLSAAAHRLYLMNAGATQLVTLPTEDVVVGARVLNAASSPANASLAWSIKDATGKVAAQSKETLSLSAGELLIVPTTDLGHLPSGNYAVTASLTLGTQQVDQIASQLRVFSPASTYRPEEQITSTNGTFSTAGGKGRVFLQGVNYWPRYTAGLEVARFNQLWLLPQNYDPDLVDLDLALLASLNFNLVSIQYTDLGAARCLVDFLDRCRKHGFWANIFVPALRSHGNFDAANSNVGSFIQAAFLTGNDRVFAYDLSWEPFIGLHATRVGIDSDWRAWITDQYGTTAAAEGAWGFSAPRDAQGQISNPLDSQIENDGSWRVMVAAYRRFIDDLLSRMFGAAARLMRSVAPGTLLSYRNGGGAAVDANYSLSPTGAVMLSEMDYDVGTAMAHLDFFSPHAYAIPIPWPGGQGLGFVDAYGRYRSGGKPILWSEYGLSIGANASGLVTQGTICDSVMRMVNDTGSAAAAVWWMPGGWREGEQSDYGILNPDGSPPPCATSLAQWGATFRTTPPAPPAGNPVTFTIDRDADARGDIGVYLRWQKEYVQARQAGSAVELVDAGTGTDTSSMPLMQVGNVPYAGSGPLKYANGEFADIQVQCGSLNITVENGAQVQVPAGSTCRLTPTLVNTGAATWLPTSHGAGGVLLHTSLGDLPLPNPVPHLARTAWTALAVTVNKGSTAITCRLKIQGTGPFGELLRLTLVGN